MHPILSALGIVAASSLAATPVELDAWKSYKVRTREKLMPNSFD